MTNVIERRVVEMDFDNSRFERNVKNSMDTLDDLHNSLDVSKSAKHFKTLSNAIDQVSMNPIGKSVDAVKVKFSALEIVAMTTLQSITRSALSTGKRVMKSLSVDQISSGWDKYNQKTAGVQTIMAATGKTIGEVNRSLEKLNWYTDETSYNFTDMINNIGKFTSSGVDLDVAVTAMEGISNWAALSGQGINEASRAYYNLAQAISVGEVKLMDWKSIENANMATTEFKKTVLEIAEAEGTLKRYADGLLVAEKGNKKIEVSVENFNEGLSAGWFTSNVLLKALGKYGEYSDKVYEVVTKEGITASEAMGKISDNTMILGEKAFKAAQEAKTFSDAINSVKDAVSTGWMTTFELIFGNYEQAKTLWTDLANTLYDIFAESGNHRNELLSEALGEKEVKISLEDWKDIYNEAGESAELMQLAVIETAKKHGIAIDQMIKDEGSFEKTLKNGWLGSDLLIESMETFDATTTEISKDVSRFDKLVDKVILGRYGNGIDRVKALTKAGYDYEGIQSIVNNRLIGTAIKYDRLNDVELKNLGYTKEEIKQLRKLAEQAKKSGTPLNKLIETMNRPSGRTLLIESLYKSLDTLVNIIETVKEAWSDVFPPATAESIYNMTVRIHELTEAMAPDKFELKKLKIGFKGLFSIFDLGRLVISNAFSAIKRVLDSVFRTLNIDMYSIIAKIGGMLVQFSNWVKENEFIERSFRFLSDSMIEVIGNIKEFIDTLVQLPDSQSAINTIIKNFKELRDSVQNGATDIPSFIKSVVDGFSKMDKVSISSVADTIIKLKDSLFEKFKSSSSNKSEIGIFSKLSNTISLFKKDTQANLNETVTNLSNFKEDTISNVNDTLEKLKDIDFGGVVATVFGFSLIKATTQFTKTIDKLLANPITELSRAATGSFDALSGALKAFQKELKAKRLIDIGIATGLLAGSIYILVLSLKEIEKLNPENLKQTLEVLGALSGILLGLSFAFSKLSNVALAKPAETVNMASVIGTFIGIAGSIYILVLALKEIEKLNPETLNQTLKTLGIIAGGLTACLVILGLTGKAYTGSALSILALALGIRIIIGSLNALKDIDIDGVKMAVSELKGIFIGIMAFMLIASVGGKRALQSSAGIFAIGGALLMMTKTIEILSKMKPTELRRGTRAVYGLMALIAVLVLMSEVAGENAGKAGLMLLGVATSLLVMSAAIQILGHMKPEAVKQGLTAVVTLMGMIGLIIFASKGAGDAKGTMLGMAFAIGALVASIGILSNIDADKLRNAVGAMSILMGMFGIMTFAVSKLKVDGKTIATLAIMVLAVGSFALILALLSRVPDPNSLITVAESMAILLGSFTVSLVIISNFAQIVKKALPTFGMMILATGLLALILGGLASIENADKVLPVAAALGIMLLSLSGAMAIAGTAAPLAAGAIGALAGAEAFIVATGALLAAIGALVTEHSSILDYLDKGVIVFEKIGNALGSLIGGVVNGILRSSTKGLYKVGMNLSRFMINMQPFFMLLDTSIKDEQIQAISNLKTIIDTINALSNITIEDNLTEFASQMKKAGPDLKAFIDATSDIAGDSANGAAEVIKIIGEAAKSLPNTGGVLGDWAGNNDIGPFFQQLSGAAPSLNRFVSETKDLKGTDVEGSVSVIKMVAEAAKTIPNDGGVFGAFVGNNNIANFARDMALAGPHLGQFLRSTEGLNLENGNSATELIKMMANAASEIYDSKGFIDKLTDKDTSVISDFANSLAEAVPSIKEFADESAGINQTALYVGRETLRKFVELSKEFPESTGIFEKSKAKEFADGIKSIGEALAKYSDSVSKVDTGAADKGNEIIRGLSNSILNKDNVADISSSFSTLITNAFSNDDGQRSGNAKNAAEKLIDYYVRGLSDSAYKATNEIEKILEKCVSKINGYYTNFKNSGKYLVEGLAKGIESYAWFAKAKARQLAKDTHEAFDNASEINSPSKLYYTSGMWAVKGFANALTDGTSIAVSSVRSMADKSFMTLANAMTDVDELLRSGGNGDDFTITPVLDLSNVERGAQSIGGMLSGYSITPGTYGINAAMGLSRSGIYNQNSVLQRLISSAMDSVNREPSVNNYYNVDGITYDDGSNISDAVGTLIRATIVERRK